MNPLHVCVISMWYRSAVINMLYLLYVRHLVCFSSKILPIKPERTERVWPTAPASKPWKDILPYLEAPHEQTFDIFSQTFSEAFSHSLIVLLGWSNAFNTHTHTHTHLATCSSSVRRAERRGLLALSLSLSLSLLPHACHCILFLTAEHIVDVQSSPQPLSTLSLSSNFK